MGGSDITTSIRYVETIATYMKAEEHYKETEEVLKNDYNIEVSYKQLMKGFTFSTSTTSLAIKVQYQSKNKDIIPDVLNTFVATTKTNVKKLFFNNELDALKSENPVTIDNVNDVSTSKILVVAASAAVGVVLGLAYEFIANSLDRTVKNKKFIEETFNVKVIGMIPDITKSIMNENTDDTNEL